MPHDIRFIEPANIQQAELLFGAFETLSLQDGEPWQQQERERKLRELRQDFLGEE